MSARAKPPFRAEHVGQTDLGRRRRGCRSRREIHRGPGERIHVLNGGREIARSTLEEISERPRVIDTYLGVREDAHVRS